MSRPQRSNVNETEKADAAGAGKLHRFELSTARIVVYGLGLVICLSWMFALGLLVGRGIPFVSSRDISLRAELLRFVGLGHETPPPPENVAETWDDSRKILQSLSYYEDLTKQGGGPPPSPLVMSQPQARDTTARGQTNAPPAQSQPAQTTQPAPQAPPSASRPESPPTPTAQTPTAATGTTQATAEATAPAQPPPPDPTPQRSAAASHREQGPSEPPSERFTLLISSMRDIENANRLMEQLRSKGYSPRLDSLDLSESGRWNRVLIGSFTSRDEALRFAVEFNRKEHSEGLVIRELD